MAKMDVVIRMTVDVHPDSYEGAEMQGETMAETIARVERAHYELDYTAALDAWIDNSVLIPTDDAGARQYVKLELTVRDDAIS